MFLYLKNWVTGFKLWVTNFFNGREPELQLLEIPLPEIPLPKLAKLIAPTTQTVVNLNIYNLVNEEETLIFLAKLHDTKQEYLDDQIYSLSNKRMLTNYETMRKMQDKSEFFLPNDVIRLISLNIFYLYQNELKQKTQAVRPKTLSLLADLGHP